MLSVYLECERCDHFPKKVSHNGCLWEKHPQANSGMQIMRFKKLLLFFKYLSESHETACNKEGLKNGCLIIN